MSRVATPASEAERQRARYRWLTPRQVGEALGVSTEHARQLIAGSALRAIDVRRPGSNHAEYRVAQEWVDAFIAERTVGAQASA